MAAGKRRRVIGVFGGSFNPVHTGHAMVANMLSQSGLVDEVWLMPGRINPLKIDGPRPADPALRLDMCRIVAEDCHAVSVSDVEMQLPEPSYTYETLCELRRRWPDKDFRIIIGSDNWQAFGRWRNPEKIIREFGVIVYPRPGFEIGEALPDNVTLADSVPQMEISSTYLRRAIAEGLNVNFLLPAKVIGYIEKHHLYKD